MTHPVAAACGALALALAGGALLLARERGADRPPSPAPAAAASPANAPAAPALVPDLSPVPPSVLARAAQARSLDRARPSCEAAPRADGAACAAPRDLVEIQWDVGKNAER